MAEISKIPVNDPQDSLKAGRSQTATAKAPEPITLDGLWKGRRLFLFPRRVTIETIFGCNAHCVMCPIDKPTRRKKGIMPMDLFRGIVDSLACHKDRFEMMDLFSLGEPLLDPHIFDRIEYVKAKGFKNVAFATNADLLDERKQKRLLDSGIDTVIFGIEGVNKETHESIRCGTDFARVVRNCESIIQLRNEGNYKTRFVIRFVKQDKNRSEWDEYVKFWKARVSHERRDFITSFDMHTWGGEIMTKEETIGDGKLSADVERQPCDVIFDILYILSDGTVPLCHEDWLHANYNFGNVREQSPLDIFNDESFHKIRDMHLAGDKNAMKMCSECTCAYSQKTKQVVAAW